MRPVRVVKFGPGHRLVGAGPVVEAGNRFLEHLIMRRFSPATVRAYAFDVANFAEFLTDRGSVSTTSNRPTCSTTWTGSPRGTAPADGSSRCGVGVRHPRP